MRAGLDAVMSAREGDSAVAARCRDRGMLLYKQDRYVEALTEFHDAKRRWLNGDSIEMSAPPAMRFDVRLMRLPSTFEPASMSWLERPCWANMTSAMVWAFVLLKFGDFGFGLWKWFT